MFKKLRVWLIYKRYGLKPIPRWEGGQYLLHLWHEGLPAFFMNHDEYLRRIVNIKRHKPKKQIKLRLELIKPTNHKTMAPIDFEGELTYTNNLHSKYCKHPNCTWTMEHKMIDFPDL